MIAKTISLKKEQTVKIEPFFNRSQEKVGPLVKKLRTIFIKITEAMRPNRKFPKRQMVKQQRFFLEYKTTC
jgi:hypothetical protein